MVGLVRSLALEVATPAVTVNAICPGFLDTEMIERSIADDHRKDRPLARAGESRARAAQPAEPPLRPAEVTATALWLCAPGADGVNGQAIAISGGEA